MKIGFNKIIVSLPIILAGLLAMVMIYASMQGAVVPAEGYIYIILLLALSIPMYFIPYLVITNTEIKANNQFGMPRRRRSISGMHDLKFENGNLFYRSGEVWQKFYFSKILADIKDLKALKTKLEEEN